MSTNSTHQQASVDSLPVQPDDGPNNFHNVGSSVKIDQEGTNARAPKSIHRDEAYYSGLPVALSSSGSEPIIPGRKRTAIQSYAPGDSSSGSEPIIPGRRPAAGRSRLSMIVEEDESTVSGNITQEAEKLLPRTRGAVARELRLPAVDASSNYTHTPVRGCSLRPRKNVIYQELTKDESKADSSVVSWAIRANPYVQYRFGAAARNQIKSRNVRRNGRPTADRVAHGRVGKITRTKKTMLVASVHFGGPSCRPVSPDSKKAASHNNVQQEVTSVQESWGKVKYPRLSADRGGVAMKGTRDTNTGPRSAQAPPRAARNILINTDTIGCPGDHTELTGAEKEQRLWKWVGSVLPPSDGSDKE